MNIPQKIPTPAGPGPLRDLQFKVNDIIDVIRGLWPKDSPTVRPTVTTIGTTFEAAAPKTSAIVELDYLQVIKERQDYLLCKKGAWNADRSIFTPTTEEVRVAKPFDCWYHFWDKNLRLAAVPPLPAAIDGYQYVYTANGTETDTRQNPWNKRTRTLVNGSDWGANEVAFPESIFPPYINGTSVILAAKLKQPFTVTETTVTNDPDPGDTAEVDFPVEWVDLTARVFRPDLQKLAVCVRDVNGNITTWYVLIEGSTRFQEI